MLCTACCLFIEIAVIDTCAQSPSPRRPGSNRNQVRRSASSIRFSSRLAVATSSCSSHSARVSDFRMVIDARLI